MLKLCWLYLPVAVSNMAPVLCKNQLQFLAVPVDGGRVFHGKALFGDHKTWRGIVVATLTGGLVFALQVWLTRQFPSVSQWSFFDISQAPLWFGFAFGFACAISSSVSVVFFIANVVSFKVLESLVHPPTIASFVSLSP